MNYEYRGLLGCVRGAACARADTPCTATSCALTLPEPAALRLPPKESAAMGHTAPDHSRFLANAEAAAWLKLSPRTLEKLRVIAGGPPFRKLGRRVLYAIESLEDWSAERTCTYPSAPNYPAGCACAGPDRRSVVWGKSGC